MKKTASLILMLWLLFSSQSTIWASSAPSLDSPTSASTTSDTSPTLSWNWSGTCTTEANVKCYRVQVDDDSNFASINKDSYTSNTTYSPQLSLGTWYWRVEAKDNTNTWSSWSEVRNFTVVQSNTPAPTPSPNPSPNPPPATKPTVRLSEFMPNPSEGKEWVEIFNYGTSSFDLNEWKIDDEPEKSSPTTLSEDTVIKPGQYKVFYISNKLNNSGDSLRLLKPDGSEFETVAFGGTIKDNSIAKAASGKWEETLTPTPGSMNKITKGEILGKEDSDSEKENESLELDLLNNLTASSSSESQRPIDNPLKPLNKEVRNFLPVILVGLGVFLLLSAVLFFLLKSGYLKKLSKRNEALGETQSAPDSQLHGRD